MRLLCAGLLALAALAPAARADTVSPAPGAAAVTIYHASAVDTADLVRGDSDAIDQGLAFITETREIDLPAGPSEIRFRGVASTMVPQTAQIEGLPAGTIERNFDYDLLSPGSLLAKSIGRTVHLIRTNPKTGKETDTPAVVRSGPNGAMLEIDGKLEALRCSGLPERLVFDSAPEGLTDTPTLVVRTNAPVAGHFRITLSYIATALNWSADYVARLHKDGQSLDLSGWLTLANFGNTGFAHVPITAVAGRLNTTGEDKPVQTAPLPLATQCWPTDIQWWTRHAPLVSAFGDRELRLVPAPPPASGEIQTIVVTAERRAEESQLGDYKLYALPEPTDLPARETKQVQFLDLHDVPVARAYRFDIDADDTGTSTDDPATLVFRLANTAAGGIGKPLPAGQIAVTEPGLDGAPVFIGRTAVRDTAVGLPVELKAGEVFSVTMNRTMVDEKKLGSGSSEHTLRTFEIEVANRRSETVTAEIAQPYYDGLVTVESETRPHISDRGFAVWRLTLKPGERAQLRVTVDVRT